MSDQRPSSLTLRQQVAALPDYVLAAWRTRYIVGEGMDFQARAILNQEAAAIRNQGKEPDARTEVAPISWTVCGLGSYVSASASCIMASQVMGER